MNIELKRPSHFEINGLADLLANFHDWLTDQTDAEIEHCALESFPSFSPEFVRFVLNSFMQIDAQTRFDAHFDHVKFVSDKISDFQQTLFS